MMCKHSWVAASPKGTVTEAVCEYCKDARIFPSNIPDEKLRKIDLGYRKLEEVKDGLER